MRLIILTLLLSVFQLLDFAHGTAINITEAPWQASILVNDKHRCGGVIYSKDFILTIAMCVRSVRRGNLAVRVGSDKKDLGGQVIPVRKVQVQVLGLRPSDVAILALQNSIVLGDTAKSIDLANWMPDLNSMASISGWAEVVGEDRSPDVLISTNLTIVRKLECSVDGFLIKRILTPDELCGSRSNSTNLVCQEFSGGPLVANGKLIGIGSWHSKCDFLQSPSVYANIHLIKLWITSTIKLMSII